MARWHVELVADRFDLEDLPDFLAAPNLRVVEEEGSFWLESESLNRLEQSGDVHREARALLPLINAYARLRRANHKDVAIGSRVEETTPEGRKKHAVVAVGTIEARTKVNAVRISQGGVPVPPPAPREYRWTDLAFQDPDVREALVVWGSKPHDWANLYKVYEVVSSRADIVAEGWASRAELRFFTHTANHPAGAGDESRHGRSATQPPKNPMPPSIADSLITRALEGWLNSLT
jgi:hypothetical protein